MVNVSIIQESIDLIYEDTEVAIYEFIDNVLLWSKYTKLKRAFIVIRFQLYCYNWERTGCALQQEACLPSVAI